MGRNSGPKIGEWDGGKLYRFRAVGQSYRKEDHGVSPDDGRLIVFEVQHEKDGPVDVLACVYADGFQGVMVAMRESGFQEGIIVGRKQKAEQIRKVLRSD